MLRTVSGQRGCRKYHECGGTFMHGNLHKGARKAERTGRHHTQQPLYAHLHRHVTLPKLRIPCTFKAAEHRHLAEDASDCHTAHRPDLLPLLFAQRYRTPRQQPESCRLLHPLFREHEALKRRSPRHSPKKPCLYQTLQAGDNTHHTMITTSETAALYAAALIQCSDKTDTFNNNRPQKQKRK